MTKKEALKIILEVAKDKQSCIALIVGLFTLKKRSHFNVKATKFIDLLNSKKV